MTMNNNDTTISTSQPIQIASTQSSNSDKGFDHKLRILSETTIKNGKRTCDSCRLRKVRCDANTVFPCTKCQDSGFACEFGIKKRKPGQVSRENRRCSGKRIKHTGKILTRSDETRERFAGTTASNHCLNIFSPSTTSELSPVQLQQQKKQQQQQGQQQMVRILPLQQLKHNSNIKLFSSMNLINKIPHMTFELAEHMIEG